MGTRATRTHSVEGTDLGEWSRRDFSPSLSCLSRLIQTNWRQSRLSQGFFLLEFADGLGPNLEAFNPHLGQVLQLAAPAGFGSLLDALTPLIFSVHSCKGEGPALRFSAMRRRKKPSPTPQKALFSLENTQTIPGNLWKFTNPSRKGEMRCAPHRAQRGGDRRGPQTPEPLSEHLRLDQRSWRGLDPWAASHPGLGNSCSPLSPAKHRGCSDE